MKDTEKLKKLRKTYASIRCENEYCSCNKCSNKEICDRVSNAIKEIESR